MQPQFVLHWNHSKQSSLGLSGEQTDGQTEWAGMINSAALHHATWPCHCVMVQPIGVNWTRHSLPFAASAELGTGPRLQVDCKQNAELAAEVRSPLRLSLLYQGSTLISFSCIRKHASSTESPGPTIREPETVEQESHACRDWPARPGGCNPHVPCSAGQGFSPLIQPAHLC